MSQMQGKPTSPFKNRNFIVLIIMILLLFVMFPLATNDNNEEMTRTEFLAMMGDSTKVITELSLQRTPDGVIVEGTRMMSDKEMAEAKQQQSAIARFTKAGSEVPNKKHFKTHMLDVTNEMASAWETYKGVKVKVIHESTTWIDTLIAFLPVLLLIAFFWIMTSRQMGGGGKNPFSFGKSQVKQLNNNKKKREDRVGETVRKYRDRTHEVLFMDLRQMGEPFEKKYIQFSPADIEKISSTYHKWQEKKIEDEPEYCATATLKEIEAKNWSLVPSKYIEFKNRDEAVDFDSKMKELQSEMRDLLKAEKESEKELAKVFKNLGYEL